MNYGRVILGGLLAGLILNIGEFLFNGVIMASAMHEWALAHNFPPEPTPTFFVAATVLTFLLGIVLVWLYALIRPRMGPGPKTAAHLGRKGFSDDTIEAAAERGEAG